MIKKQKGQASFEFLLTYGWAILVVLGAISALAYFGVTSADKKISEYTQFGPSITNIGKAYAEKNGNITIALVNNAGVTINLTNIKETQTNTCEPITQITIITDQEQNLPVILKNGEQFRLIISCAQTQTTKIKTHIELKYVNPETQVPEVTQGTITAKTN